MSESVSIARLDDSRSTDSVVVVSAIICNCTLYLWSTM